MSSTESSMAVSGNILLRQNKIHNPHTYEGRRTICGSIEKLRSKYSANELNFDKNTANTQDSNIQRKNQVKLRVLTTHLNSTPSGKGNSITRPQSVNLPLKQTSSPTTTLHQKLLNDNQQDSASNQSPLSSSLQNTPTGTSYTPKRVVLARPASFIVSPSKKETTLLETRPKSYNFLQTSLKESSRSITPEKETSPRAFPVGSRESTSSSITRYSVSPPKLEETTHTESSPAPSKYRSAVNFSMASTSSEVRYDDKSLEDLNKMLRETREFEERRVIRAAIRKIKESSSPVKASENEQLKVTPTASVFGDLNGYTQEEDLKALLHQTTIYEEKKRIRQAIRELRKRNDEKKTTESAEGNSRDKITPESPSAFNVLRDLSNGTSDLSLSSNQNTGETILSPVQHDTKFFHQSDGDVKVETMSKHSRTVSQSDLLEKSTKVRKTSTIGNIEVFEEDEIVTRTKTALSGSTSEESDFIVKVGMREAGGSEIVEEEISVEKKSHSIETGEETTTQLEISVLKSKSPPKVVACLETPVEIIDGDSLTLSCEFDLSEDVEIQWTKGGAALIASKDISLSWTSTLAKLEISEVLYPDDCGEYICTALNSLGSASTSAVVKIVADPRIKAPVLVKGLEDISAVDGEAVTFTTTIEQMPNTSVAWYKGGKKLKHTEDFQQKYSGGKASLCISEVFPEDQGQISVMISNSAGRVESNCNLTVKDKHIVGKVPKLTFSQGLSDVTVMDGQENFSFTCSLSDVYKKAKIIWYRDGKVLKDSADFKQTFDGQIAKLTLSEIFPDDSGEYECLVANESAEVSTFCNLKVQNKGSLSHAAESSDSSKHQTDGNNNIDLIDDVTELQKILDKTKDEAQKEIIQAKLEAIKQKKNDATNVQPDIKQEEEKEKSSEAMKTGKSASPPAEAETVQKEAVSSRPQEDLRSVQEVGAGKSKSVQLNAFKDKKSQEATKKPTAIIEKPALKSVPKPAGGTASKPAADSTAESLVEKLSKSSSTFGEVKVSQQTWMSSNGGALKKTQQTSASKSWGKMGGMSALLGKGAPAGARGAMAAFKQMDTSSNPNAAAKPNYARTTTVRPSQPGVQRSATEIKQSLLNWCRSKTQDYENVKIENFSSSWNDGVAFLALIHHFYPDTFNWEKVDPRRRKENFTLAFDLAEKKADISPLLDVEDMVRMKKPDWKCVFTYVQSFYRKLRDHENNKHTYPTTP